MRLGLRTALSPGSLDSRCAGARGGLHPAALWVHAAVVVWALGCNRTDGSVVSDAPMQAAPAEGNPAASPPTAEAKTDGESKVGDSGVTLASAPTPAADPDHDGERAGDGEAEATPAAAAPEPPPQPSHTQEDPATVLILGDSFAATGFGALLERRLDAHPAIVCHRKGKSSSGLARPDFFDWFAESKRQIALRDPDLVVVIVGGNDGQDLSRRVRGERRVAWQHEDWEGAYRERVDLFLDQISGEERDVLWLGLPTMGLRSFERKLGLIRRIQQEAVEARGDGFVYLATAPYVSDEAGEMLTHAQVGKGQKTQKIRAEDEIHFTMSGSEYLADKVYPEVLGTLLLDDIPVAEKPAG